MALSAALFLIVLPQSSARGGELLTLDKYRRLIAVYREGDFQNSAEALAAFERRPVQKAAEEFAALGSDPEDPAELRAAALLHSETGAYLRDQYEFGRGDHHWNIARSLSKLAGVNQDASGRVFQSRWLLAAGCYYQSEAQGARAVDLLQEALRLSDKDAEIPLALGAVHEVSGSLWRRGESPTFLPSGPVTSRAEREQFRARSTSRKQLATAEGFYREALRLDPALAEAHLRVGRVLERLGEDEKAQPELEWVIDNSRDPYLLGLAQLFLGVLHEEKEEWSEAIEAYRRAVAAKPKWQVTHLALSHALNRAGVRREAETEIHATLKLKVREDTTDSGWEVYYVLRVRSAGIMNALKKGIRP